MFVVSFRRRRRPKKILRFFQASRVDFILFFNDLCRNESAKPINSLNNPPKSPWKIYIYEGTGAKIFKISEIYINEGLYI